MSQNDKSLALWQAWQALDKGSRAQLRRAAMPDALRDIPAFYKFVAPFGWPENREQLLRMVFCLAVGKEDISHSDDAGSLGQALAKSGKISESRLFQLIHMDEPNNLVQLRRLIIHAKPKVKWPLMAEQLAYWHTPAARRRLLEDFIMATIKKNGNKKENKESSDE